METNDILIYIGLVIFGLFFGALTMRSSNKREETHSSGIAQVFHYLSCSLMTGLTPFVLLTVIFVRPEWVEIGGLWVAPLVQVLGIAVLLFALAVVLLIPFAHYERPAIEATQRQEAGWTREDAVASGL